VAAANKRAFCVDHPLLSLVLGFGIEVDFCEGVCGFNFAFLL